MNRNTLVCISGGTLGLIIAAAIPVVGRIVPGAGKGGAIFLAVATLALVGLAPAQHKLAAIIMAIACWVIFAISASTGDFTSIGG